MLSPELLHENRLLQGTWRSRAASEKGYIADTWNEDGKTDDILTRGYPQMTYEQQDIAATLSLLLGTPTPESNTGAIIPEIVPLYNRSSLWTRYTSNWWTKPVIEDVSRVTRIQCDGVAESDKCVYSPTLLHESSDMEQRSRIADWECQLLLSKESQAYKTEFVSLGEIRNNTGVLSLWSWYRHLRYLTESHHHIAWTLRARWYRISKATASGGSNADYSGTVEKYWQKLMEKERSASQQREGLDASLMTLEGAALERETHGRSSRELKEKVHSAIEWIIQNVTADLLVAEIGKYADLLKAQTAYIYMSRDFLKEIHTTYTGPVASVKASIFHSSLMIASIFSFAVRYEHRYRNKQLAWGTLRKCLLAAVVVGVTILFSRSEVLHKIGLASMGEKIQNLLCVVNTAATAVLIRHVFRMVTPVRPVRTEAGHNTCNLLTFLPSDGSGLVSRRLISAKRQLTPFIECLLRFLPFSLPIVLCILSRFMGMPDEYGHLVALFALSTFIIYLVIRYVSAFTFQEFKHVEKAWQCGAQLLLLLIVVRLDSLFDPHHKSRAEENIFETKPLTTSASWRLLISSALTLAFTVVLATRLFDQSTSEDAKRRVVSSWTGSEIHKTLFDNAVTYALQGLHLIPRGVRVMLKQEGIRKRTAVLSTLR